MLILEEKTYMVRHCFLATLSSAIMMAFNFKNFHKKYLIKDSKAKKQRPQKCIEILKLFQRTKSNICQNA